jgi:hypothetical protein
MYSVNCTLRESNKNITITALFTAEFGWVAWGASIKQNMSMVHASRGSKNKIIRS